MQDTTVQVIYSHNKKTCNSCGHDCHCKWDACDCGCDVCDCGTVYDNLPSDVEPKAEERMLA